MNKQELLAHLEQSHDRIMEAIEDLTQEKMETPGVVGEWSIKDLLAHITRWEAELIKLLWQIRQGLKPSGVLVNDESVDDTNARWYQEDRGRGLEQVIEDFQGVRPQTIRRLAQFTDAELADPNRYPWAHHDPLISWIAGNSFEHDLEHLEQIMAWRRGNAG
jgi:hypothetical protein